MINKFLSLIFFVLLFLNCFCLSAQDKRLQYPAALSNSFSGVSIGYINYPFTQQQLEPGYHAASVHVPHTAVRIVLFGHEFNKWLSAQITYMRPVDWVKYKNINGDGLGHTVWMNIAGLSVKAQAPAGKKFSIYGEAGLSIITRHGFSINNEAVVRNANYATVLTGAGLQYHLNNKWRLMLSTVYSPSNSKLKQPHTIFYSAGFNYIMRPLPDEKLKRNIAAGYKFPKNLVQLGYATNVLGYGVNNAVSKGPIPIFWGGDAQIGLGFSLHYQHNIFHALKVFSFDWGTSFSFWQSRTHKDKFFTASLFPLLRFTAFRSKATDIYFNYSVAGPSYISKLVIEGSNTGKHFTFQDFMGMGAYIGINRKLNAEIRIMHFSNGNLFPQNTGVMIPLTFNLGYAF
jgi:hypothetical protein